MKAMLKSVWTVGVNGKVTNVTFNTEVEVTADTNEDSLEEVLEAIRELVLEMYGENTLKCNWNDEEIYKLADRLAA